MPDQLLFEIDIWLNLPSALCQSVCEFHAPTGPPGKLRLENFYANLENQLHVITFQSPNIPWIK